MPLALSPHGDFSWGLGQKKLLYSAYLRTFRLHVARVHDKLHQPVLRTDSKYGRDILPAESRKAALLLLAAAVDGCWCMGFFVFFPPNYCICIVLNRLTRSVHVPNSNGSSKRIELFHVYTTSCFKKILFLVNHKSLRVRVQEGQNEMEKKWRSSLGTGTQVPRVPVRFRTNQACASYSITGTN